jgi:hypothetical protein
MSFKLKSQSPIKQKEDPYVSSRIKNAKAQKEPGYKKSSGAMSFEEYGNKHPIIKAAVQIADPTGISSYGDVKKAWNDNKTNYSDIVEPLSALPVIGKIGKTIKGLKIGTDIFKEFKASKALRVVNKTTDAYDAAKSPLQKQKLSPKAAKAKAERDLAYAKTDDRRKKKAHSQRMHRKHPGNKGKDYDHEDGRFESVKQNRGNEGEGTKKESGKKYKIT